MRIFPVLAASKNERNSSTKSKAAAKGGGRKDKGAKSKGPCKA
jgi:hypothetical protein